MCTQGEICPVRGFSVAYDELGVEMPSTIWSAD